MEALKIILRTILSFGKERPPNRKQNFENDIPISRTHVDSLSMLLWLSMWGVADL